MGQRGKPPFSEREIKVIGRMASHGLTQKQIADYFDLSISAFEQRIVKHPELARVIKKGRVETIDLAAGKLIEAVKKGQAWAICFFLKTRGQFYENIKVDGEVKHTADESFAQAVSHGPKIVKQVISKLPKKELDRIKRMYESGTETEPRVH